VPQERPDRDRIPAEVGADVGVRVEKEHPHAAWLAFGFRALKPREHPQQRRAVAQQANDEPPLPRMVGHQRGEVAARQAHAVPWPVFGFLAGVETHRRGRPRPDTRLPQHLVQLGAVEIRRTGGQLGDVAGPGIRHLDEGDLHPV